MKKVLLLILDGYGINKSEFGNAIKAAKTPVMDKLLAVYPHTELEASGEYVGLPKGQMGNSEVGHMTIGSGRVTLQPLTYINEKIKNKEFFDNELLNETMSFVKENNSTLHLIGLLSNGGVHSSINHFYAVLAMCKLKGVKNVVFHVITDGRDTNRESGINFVTEFMDKAEKLGIGKLATICGRYYAMDRDNRWERIKKAYNAIVYESGNIFPNFKVCFNEHYKREITDEFINPSIITSGCTIHENDAVLFMNFRPERMTEIIDALTNKSFKMFKTKQFENVKFVSLFNINKNIPYAFDIERPKNTLGEYLMELDYTQARIAETEKYAHVTYFFDGGMEKEFPLCDKVLIPSPKVATYDLKPEMSAYEVCDKLLEELDKDYYGMVILNFANCDMVGHTGIFPAACSAVEAVDTCAGKVVDAIKEMDGVALITADHGNADKMYEEDGSPFTAHTTNPVPFCVVNYPCTLREGGKLADIAPTMLKILGLPQPKEMTGTSIIE